MEQARRAKLEGLEALRWFAAAAIIVYHVATIPAASPGDRTLAVVEFLSFGVPLFYVVSAFGLWYGYLGKLGTRQEIGHFYRRRFFRIAPLFYVMLAFFIVMLGFDVSWAKVATSVTFTFNLVPQHVEGIVWASWSVGVEMLFYAIMPALALLARDLRRAVALFVGAVALAFVWNQIFADATGTMEAFAFFSLANFLYFFAAGVVALLAFVRFRDAQPDSVRPLGVRLLGAAAAMIAVLVFLDPHETLVRAGWAVALSCLTVGLSAAPLRGLVNGVTRRLGEASFSLYLLHPPVIGLMDRAGIIDKLYDVVGPAGFLLAVLLAFAVVIPASLLTYRYIEKPGMRLGGSGALARRRTPAETPRHPERTAS